MFMWGEELGVKRVWVSFLLLAMLFSVLPTAWAEEAPQEELGTRMVGVLGTDRMTVGDAAATYTVSFQTASTATWKVSSSSGWLTVNTPTVTGNSTVSYSVKKNPDATTRVAVITLTTGSSAINTKQITVVQGKLVYPVNGYNIAEEIHHVNDKTKGEVVNGIGSITSFYGYRTTAGTYKRHWAIDIDVPDSKTNVLALAALNGKVVTVGKGDDEGNYVVLQHTVIDSNGRSLTFRTKYLHLKSISVSEDTNVRAGTPIGIVGGTGSAEGDVHLHFTIRKNIGGTYYHINPVAYYHGCDDRGTLYKDGMAIASLRVYDNNPMFLIKNEIWVVNPDWDPTYALLTSKDCAFYKNYMCAKRNGEVVHEAYD